MIPASSLRAALAAAVLIPLGLGTGVAEAADSVRIATPARDALVATPTVPVRLQADANVTAVRVHAGSQDLSRYFKRVGRAFTARVPRAALKPGANQLLAEAMTSKRAGGTDSRTFILSRRAPADMTTKSGNAAGQVSVAIATKTATYAALTVNGHRVEDLRAQRRLNQHSWLVSAADGLRLGQNRFRVVSWDRDGRFAVKRWTEHRSAKLPLTEAGTRERMINPKRWTSLDGSASRPVKPGRTLRYAWRVTSAPKGAKPQLRNATSAKPQIKTDVQGEYRVALRATEQGGGSAEDVVTLAAVAPLPSQGRYLDTTFHGAQSSYGQPPFNALWYQGCAYPAFTGAPNVCIQLDETTLALVDYGMPQNFGPQAGRVTICAWGSTSLTGPNAISWLPFSETNGSAIFIGTTLVASNRSNNNWQPFTGNPTSSLQGWLKPASPDGDATWVDSSMVQAKTRRSTDTETTNTMEIDGTAYEQTLSGGATGGFHLVQLDHTGSVVTNQLYPLTGNAANDTATENNLATAITKPTFTTLLQAFGKVAALPGNGNLANAIEAIGGRADVVDRFGPGDATGGVYSLIGAPTSGRANAWSPGYRAEEASFERTGTTGTLTSLLVRDPSANDYIPFATDSATLDPNGSNRYSLMAQVSGPATSWNQWIRNGQQLLAPTTAQNAAYNDLLTQVTNEGFVPNQMLCPAAPDVIRGFYCTTAQSDLGDLATNILTLDFDAGTAGSRYTAADWTTVRNSIVYEINDTAAIRAGIARYQMLFGTASVSAAVNAPALADAIKSQVGKATEVATQTNLGNVMSAITAMGSALDPAINPALTFLSGAFAFEQDLVPNSSPSPAIQDAVTVTQDTAATTVVNQYQAASEDLSDWGDVMVSDPAKLRAGAAYMKADDASTGDQRAVLRAAEFGTQQYLWGTILASAYSAWVVPANLGTSPFCANSSSIGSPWENLSSTGSWPSTAGSGPGRSSTNWLLGFDNQSGQWGWANNDGKGGLNDAGLPGTISDPLFGRVTGSGGPSATADAGAIMPYFALDYLPIKSVPVASNFQTNPAMPGCQPQY